MGFEGPVVEAFSKVLADLRHTIELQHAQAEEATATIHEKLVAKEAAAREVAELEDGLVEARASAIRLEEEVQATQHKVELYAQWSKAEHAALRLRHKCEASDEVARAATSKADEARLKFRDYRNWIEDLQAFFKGHRARDSHAIMQGLGNLLPDGDPLPRIVGPMLSEKHIDITSSTVRSVGSVLEEHMHRGAAMHGKVLQQCESACHDSNRQLAEVTQLLTQQEAQVQKLRSQVGRRAIATPVRNSIEPGAPHRSSSSGGLTRPGATVVRSSTVEPREAAQPLPSARTR